MALCHRNTGFELTGFMALPSKNNQENKEHHGYGLKSIRKTVEKYDGELVVEIRGNIFRAVAFMTCIDYV